MARSSEIENARVEYNKDIGLMIVYLTTKADNPVETLEGPFDGSVLFHFDSKTREVVKITICDFSVIRRKLMKNWIFLITKQAIIGWITTLVETLKSANTLSAPSYQPVGS